MKETILRSKKFPNLILQIFDEKTFGMLGENLSKNEREKSEDEDDFFTNNEEYAYEVLKLLQEAKRRGIFAQEEKKEDGLKEEILI